MAQAVIFFPVFLVSTAESVNTGRVPYRNRRNGPAMWFGVERDMPTMLEAPRADIVISVINSSSGSFFT
ncbi:hypothetical protein [Streptosporangium sp. NPDC000239]|uniref:hypothetical protein n=1 Tax=unclassified Streptosporangium TaxID=2632669 RepID=UPI003316E089